MSPRTRISVLVAAAAVGAAGVAVGVALIQSGEDGVAAVEQQAQLPKGPPPLLLDLGFRRDREAVELRRAQELYDGGSRVAAARVFAGYRSPEAAIGGAFARWPDGTLRRLESLSREQPRSALVRLHLGFALFWSGRRRQGLEAWRAALRVEPDSISAVRADDLLHPNVARGLPTFVPSFEAPASIVALPPERQLAALAKAARGGGWREKLLYGVGLQRSGRPISARRELDAAAAASPGNVEARVAAAVARFDKSHPERAFGLLGPLTRTKPRNQSVRFHLGLLLLWIGDVAPARRQLELARRAGPGTLLGREAERFLDRLEDVGKD